LRRYCVSRERFGFLENSEIASLEFNLPPLSEGACLVFKHFAIWSLGGDHNSVEQFTRGLTVMSCAQNLCPKAYTSTLRVFLKHGDLTQAIADFV